MFRTKVVEENKIYTLCSVHFPVSVTVYKQKLFLCRVVSQLEKSTHNNSASAPELYTMCTFPNFFICLHITTAWADWDIGEL
jgi:hypothetical protein